MQHFDGLQMGIASGVFGLLKIYMERIRPVIPGFAVDEQRLFINYGSGKGLNQAELANITTTEMNSACATTIRVAPTAFRKMLATLVSSD